MQITPRLEKKIAQAVQTSMLIEGYKPPKSEEVKALAKALIEQYGVKISDPKALACRIGGR